MAELQEQLGTLYPLPHEAVADCYIKSMRDIGELLKHSANTSNAALDPTVAVTLIQKSFDMDRACHVRHLPIGTVRGRLFSPAGLRVPVMELAYIVENLPHFASRDAWGAAIKKVAADNGAPFAMRTVEDRLFGIAGWNSSLILIYQHGTQWVPQDTSGWRTDYAAAIDSMRPELSSRRTASSPQLPPPPRASSTPDVLGQT
jgi:hypothetical protein